MSNVSCLVKPPRVPERIKPGAFTLIELLVVVAIIAILASLLLPAMAKAKERSRDVYCRNNLRLLNLAWTVYEGEYSKFPPNVPFDVMSVSRQNWVGNGMSYETSPAFSPSWPVTDNTNVLKMVDPKFGCLGSYVGNPALYKCPSDNSYVMLDQMRHSRVRSYSMNIYIGETIPQDGRKKYFLKSTDFHQSGPANIFVFLDEHEDWIYDGAFDIFTSTPNLGYWPTLPANRHSRGGNLSFADGHVERRRWIDRRTIEPVLRLNRVLAQQTGNKDVTWITQKARGGP